jgi:Glycosyl hydrolase family 26
MSSTQSASGIIYGAMTDTTGDEQLTEQMIKKFNALAKKNIAVAYFTHHWKHKVEPFPKSMCDFAKNQSAVPYIRMNAYEASSTDITCKSINSGQHDNDLIQYAKDAKAWDGLIYAEIGTEVNGGNKLAFSEEGSTAYKQMARKVIELFKAQGATNVHFCFHGDFNNPRTNPGDWYPGDDLFDWIGTTMYGQENKKGCIGSLEQTYNGKTYYDIWSATGSKPLAILEWGLGTEPDTTNTLTGIPAKYPRIGMMLYWNEKGDYDRRINKSTKNLKAFRKGIANPVYLDKVPSA